MAKKEPDALSHITLAPGQPEVEVPTTRLGRPSSVFLLRGAVYPVLPDDSREDGIGETLARDLVVAGRCVPVGPRGGLHDAETPIVPAIPAEPNRTLAEQDVIAVTLPAASEGKPAAD